MYVYIIFYFLYIRIIIIANTASAAVIFFRSSDLFSGSIYIILKGFPTKLIQTPVQDRHHNIFWLQSHHS